MVLDSGALIDIEATPRGETFRSCVKAFEDGYRPYLPTVVLAQVWRGRAQQHPLLMVRRLCILLPFTEHTAAVLTSDPKDLATLASAADYPVRLLTV